MSENSNSTSEGVDASALIEGFVVEGPGDDLDEAACTYSWQNVRIKTI